MICLRNNMQHSRSKRTQSGISLIEVLVAVVVISVGLLGIAALHVTSLRTSYDANTRSKAVWFAYDIADRMRANATSAKNGDYIVAMGSTPTGATVAALDLQTWKDSIARVKTGLPNGDGSITSATFGANTLFTITVQWQERDSTVPLSFAIKTEI
jgi:type IV pilus assembly protein PilV